MVWTIEYFERENTLRPAEIFEDKLDHDHPKISGKLIAIIRKAFGYWEEYQRTHHVSSVQEERENNE